MAVRNANATWKGSLKEGSGSMALGSGAFEGSYSFASRFEEGQGTNPEELIGAAHAGCYSMALSHALAEAGYTPKRVQTSAKVHIDPEGDGFAIGMIELHTEAEVPGIDDSDFQAYAADAKENCPVSKALAGVPIELNASLVSS